MNNFTIKHKLSCVRAWARSNGQTLKEQNILIHGKQGYKLINRKTKQTERSNCLLDSLFYESTLDGYC